ncbi:MAG: histidine phosphatase family protein [Acidimicrobiales bacterium]
MRVFILLRHARTSNNAEARLQGQVDPPLDDVGIAQAQRAGAYVRSRWQIDAVVSSAMERTKQTLEYGGFSGYETVTDHRWSEIDFGTYDQRRIGEVVTKLSARWRSDLDYQPEGGESLSAMHERVVEACVELAPRAADENILVVTHAMPIKSAAVWALGGSASMILNMWVNLSTVSVLAQVRGEFILAEYNTPSDHSGGL